VSTKPGPCWFGATPIARRDPCRTSASGALASRSQREFRAAGDNPGTRSVVTVSVVPAVGEVLLA
jgi:hypothetical protein